MHSVLQIEFNIDIGRRFCKIYMDKGRSTLIATYQHPYQLLPLPYKVKSTQEVNVGSTTWQMHYGKRCH